MEPWKSILVGVDATPESARAAALGWAIARQSHARFRLVHVEPETASDAQVLARDAVETALRRTVPQPVINHLEIHLGPVADVLADLALDAELLVLGGKHHTALGRWLVGSTVHRLVRTATVPMLIAGPVNTGLPRRVLAAVDLSTAAAPTLACAARFARMLEADLGALHVVEPLPPPLDPLLGPLQPAPSIMDDEPRLRAAAQVLGQAVWPAHRYPTADRLMRRGPAAETIAEAARDWQADVLVVGSHGRNFIERLLLGSVADQLLNDLPMSLLVVPALRPVKITEPGRVNGALALGMPA
jgi:nucleotide-binding universal stress UspA family protein